MLTKLIDGHHPGVAQLLQGEELAPEATALVGVDLAWMQDLQRDEGVGLRGRPVHGCVAAHTEDLDEGVRAHAVAG